MAISARTHAILRTSLALAAGLCLLGLRLYSPGLEHHATWDAGVAYDLLVVLALWSAGHGMARVLRDDRAWLATAFLYLTLGFALALVHIHSTFFWAAVERRLTAFDISPSGIVAFYTDTLPAQERVPLAVLVLSFHGLALLLLLALRNRPRALARAGTVCVSVALTAGLLVLARERVTSPLYDTFDEARLVVRAPKITPAAQAPVPLVKALDRSDAAPQAALRFDKIVVLVMETMTERKLAAETPALPASTFFKQQRPHSHRYTRYLANNQDSRTGMLDMLASRLIPYEAYSDAGLAGYENLARLPSLLTPLHGLGYRTAFAVSQVALEEVVTDLPWDERLSLDAQEIAAARQARALCLTPDIYEQGCEDLVLLPEVVSFLERSDRAFVYQEFIWGHAHEYNDASGKTNAFYYSAYADALIAALRAKGLLERTLIVLTSDHGFRDKSLQAERWVYELPLWFHASRFAPRESAGLFSHVDFRRLLFAEASEGGVPEASPLVMSVGPTGSNIFSAFTPEGDMIVTRRVGRFELLLSPTERKSLSPETMLATRNAYLRVFDAALRRP